MKKIGRNKKGQASFTQEELRLAVSKSYSIANVLRLLGYAPKGGNYETIKKYLQKWEIDTIHFTGQTYNKGKTYRKLEDMLTNPSYTCSSAIRKRILKEGVKEHECECCGREKWLDAKIPLELHHIDGDRNNNLLENLQLLCPNCHEFTENYRGKNISKDKVIDIESNLEKYEKAEKHLENSWARDRKVSLKTKKLLPAEKPACKKCGEKCSRYDSIFCSYECAKSVSRQNIPSKEELISVFKEKKNFVQVGNHYGKSDNAVRKWCKKYGILDQIKNKEF